MLKTYASGLPESWRRLKETAKETVMNCFQAAKAVVLLFDVVFFGLTVIARWAKNVIRSVH